MGKLNTQSLHRDGNKSLPNRKPIFLPNLAFWDIFCLKIICIDGEKNRSSK